MPGVLLFILFSVSIVEGDCSHPGKQNWIKRRSPRSKEHIFLRWQNMAYLKQMGMISREETKGKIEGVLGTHWNKFLCEASLSVGPWTQRPWGPAGVFEPYPGISGAIGEL